MKNKSYSGGNHPQAKLTNKQADEIRLFYNQGF